MKYKMNIADMNGNIQTGYEGILEGTKDRCFSKYILALSLLGYIESKGHQKWISLETGKEVQIVAELMTNTIK